MSLHLTGQTTSFPRDGAETYDRPTGTRASSVDIAVRAYSDWGTHSTESVIVILGGISFQLASDGTPVVTWLSAGVTLRTVSADEVVPFLDDPGRFWLRVLMEDDGDADVTFWWSASDTDDPDLVLWTQMPTEAHAPMPFTFSEVDTYAQIGDSTLATVPMFIRVATVRFDGVDVINPMFWAESSAPFTDSTGAEWFLFGEASLSDPEPEPDPPSGDECGLLLPTDGEGANAYTEDYDPGGMTTSWMLKMRIESDWVTGVSRRMAGERGSTIEVGIDDGAPWIAWDDGTSWSTITSPTPWPFMDAPGTYWLIFAITNDSGSALVEFSWASSDTDNPEEVVDTLLWSQSGVKDFAFDRSSWPNEGFGIGDPVGGQSYFGFVRQAQVTIDAAEVLRPEFSFESVMPFTDANDATWLLDGEASFVPCVAEQVDVSIDLTGAAAQAIVNAPRIWTDEDLASPLRFRLMRLPDMTPVMALNETVNEQFREQRNATGSGSAELLIDDPAAAVVRRYDLIQGIIDGQVAFTWVNENPTITSHNPDEEAGERIELSGRGHLALLEHGLVYPSRGLGHQPVERDRQWNWASRGYDDSWWAPAVPAGVATGPPRQPGNQEGPPEGGPSVTGNAWLASDGDTQALAPLGDVYYRGTISVPANGTYTVMWAADNFGELYMEGQRLDTLDRWTGDNWLTAHRLEVELTAGDVLFAAKATNVGSLSDFPNPVGLWLVLVTTNSEGEVDQVIGFASPATFRALGRPSQPPGMTPGRVARLVIEEWRARATAAGQDIAEVTLSSTDDVDSAGQPWPTAPNIATKVGTDLLTFFGEMAATHFEMRMRPGSLVLDLWLKGTTPPSGVVYTPALPSDPTVGNVRSLVRRVL